MKQGECEEADSVRARRTQEGSQEEPWGCGLKAKKNVKAGGGSRQHLQDSLSSLVSTEVTLRSQVWGSFQSPCANCGFPFLSGLSYIIRTQHR